jgi:Inhibitor of Apoptosis domain
MQGTYTSWEHSSVTLTPAVMAKGGFIQMQSAPESDNAVCPYCCVNLDGWEEGDDPLLEHSKRDPKGKCMLLKGNSY